MNDNSQYLYILNLNRLRIVVISLIFLGICSGLFFLGLAVGIKSSRMIPSETAADTVSEDGTAVEVGSQFNSLDDESPSALTGSIAEEPALIEDSSRLLAAEEKLSGRIQPAKDTGARMQPAADAKEPASGDNRWYIQLIATSDKAKAERLKKTLISKKYKGYTRVKTDGERTIYMVRVGLYTDKAKAESDLLVLQKKGGFHDAVLVIQKKTNASTSAVLTTEIPAEGT